MLEDLVARYAQSLLTCTGMDLNADVNAGLHA